MRKARIRDLLLEAKQSSLLTPQERLDCAFEFIEFAIEFHESMKTNGVVTK